jgi:hypothetical protein
MLGMCGTMIKFLALITAGSLATNTIRAWQGRRP